MKALRWLAGFSMLVSLHVLAQTQFNPVTQINWLELTGTTAPTQTCPGPPPLGALVGQHWTDSTNYLEWVCTPAGWNQPLQAPKAIPYADPNYYNGQPGVADSAVGINDALGAQAFGVIRDVVLGAGVYHVKSPIVVAPGQCLKGIDGWGAILDVSTDFSTTANGVVVVSPTGNTPNQKACVKNITFQFNQPPDAITSTTAGSAVSANTITVASGAACAVNDIVYDVTNPSAIPNQYGNFYVQYGLTFVQSASGNILTLTNPVLAPGVGSGDVINCAPQRSAATTLAQGCSLVAGSPMCKYPWAIYNNGSQNFDAEDTVILDGWDGFYQRGQTYHYRNNYFGTVDQAINVDQAFNYSQIDEFEQWNFHVGNNTNLARDAVYYDGSNVCANLGETDGAAIGKMQCWVGKVNITSTWSWGSIAILQQDGANSDLNIQGASGSNNYLKIGKFSHAGTPSAADGYAISQNAPGFRTTIDDASLNVFSRPGISVSDGDLKINTGLLSTGQGVQGAVVSGGMLEMENMGWLTNGACVAITGGFVQQTGGALVLHDNIMETANCAQPVVNSNFDSTLNSIVGNTFQSWTFTPPGINGYYADNSFWTGSYTADYVHNPAVFDNGVTVNGYTVMTGAEVLTTGGGSNFQSLWLHNNELGATNPDKCLRITADGTLQILNSAFCQGTSGPIALWSLQDNGLVEQGGNAPNLSTGVGLIFGVNNGAILSLSSSITTATVTFNPAFTNWATCVGNFVGITTGWQLTSANRNGCTWTFPAIGGSGGFLSYIAIGN